MEKRHQSPSRRAHELRLNRIFEKTAGRCHVCRKQLARGNYGKVGRRGAWQVDHGLPVAGGGTDHLNNLWPICIACNAKKGTRSSRSARAEHGRARPPLSRDKIAAAKRRNLAGGAILGGALGLLFGPVGAVAGAGVGSLLGYHIDPET